MRSIGDIPGLVSALVWLAVALVILSFIWFARAAPHHRGGFATGLLVFVFRLYPFGRTALGRGYRDEYLTESGRTLAGRARGLANAAVVVLALLALGYGLLAAR